VDGSPTDNKQLAQKFLTQHDHCWGYFMLVNYSLGPLTFFTELTEHCHVFTENVFTTAPVTEKGLTMLQWVP